jgi:inner membrane transporter RhtA
LGPAFAVLLFAQIRPLGVAWLRIASAGVVFAVWRRPWRYVNASIAALGLVLAAMNVCFYLAIARLPLATVGAIEFLGPVALAAAGARTRRNLVALALATAGVYTLSHLRFTGDPLAYVFAFANCALFVVYVVLGLGAAMLVAMVVALPLGIREAMPAFHSPMLLAAAVGVGVSSSVIPYVCDQLAMARLPRSTFAFLLALLPATATVVGLLALHQVPTHQDLIGVAWIIAAVALHRSPPRHEENACTTHELEHPV